jgi:hypothetical protein
MATHRNCDGTTRRDVLKVGVLGGVGLTLGRYLRLAAADEVRTNAAKQGIFIDLGGGPSHMDTFDLKPEAPDGFRGEFQPIDTNAPGVQISEHLPKLARCANEFAILRGVTHTLAAHQLGAAYVNTGNKPIPSLEFPGCGAVATKELQGPSDLPPFVAIPENKYQKGGYLGIQYAPLSTGSTPQPGRPFSVRGISIRSGLTVADVEKREDLLKDLDKTFKDVETGSQLLEGLDKFGQQAHTIITSQRARDAFDVSRESPAFADTFGTTPFGQSCLLASRLVESGVRFVTITLGGWDTHQDNFGRLKGKLLPTLDEGLAALLTGLRLKGLLESTAVYVTGEFGRTPKINGNAGRDHYPRAMFMLLAGGAVRGGQVLGASDEKGAAPAGSGYSPDDVAASFYHNLGIDPRKEYETSTGRPVMIVRYGKIIDGLFG